MSSINFTRRISHSTTSSSSSINELGYTNDKDKIGRLEEKLSVEMLNSIISVQDLQEDYLGFVKRLRRLNAAQKHFMSKKNT